MNKILRYFRSTIFTLTIFSLVMVFYNFKPENHLTYIGDIIPGTIEKGLTCATHGFTTDTIWYDTFSFDWRPKTAPSEVRHEPMVNDWGCTVWKTSNDWKNYRAPGPFVFPKDATDESFADVEPAHQYKKWLYFKQGKVYKLMWYNKPKCWLLIAWVLSIFCWIFGTNQGHEKCYRGCPFGAICCACRSHLNTDDDFYKGKLFYFMRYMVFIGYKKSELNEFINWVWLNRVRVPLTAKTFEAFIAAGGVEGKPIEYKDGKFIRMRKHENADIASGN